MPPPLARLGAAAALLGAFLLAERAIAQRAPAGGAHRHRARPVRGPTGRAERLACRARACEDARPRP